MSQKGRVRLVLALLTVLAAGGWGAWWFSRNDGASSSAGPQSAELPSSTPAEIATELVMQLLPEEYLPTAPLPPLGLAFRDIAGVLRARALEGDAVASCRLAAGYTYCAQLVRARSEMATWLDTREAVIRNRSGGSLGGAQGGERATGAQPVIETTAEESFRRDLAVRESRIATLELQCRDVSIPEANEVAKFWRLSAESGNAFAAHRYVSGQHIDGAQLAFMAGEIQAFRTTAAEVAWRGARRGDPTMLVMLGDAYSSNLSSDYRPLAQLLKKDPAMAAALYRHAERAVRESTAEAMWKAAALGRLADKLAAVDRDLTPEQASRSRQLLAEWGAPGAGANILVGVSDEADARCTAGSSLP